MSKSRNEADETLSLALPADAVACVFEDDAALQELVAYLVGAGEVAAAAGFLSLVDEGLNLRVEHLARGLREDVEDGVEAADEFEQVALIV